MICLYFPFFLFLPSLKAHTALDVLRSGTTEDASRAGYRQEMPVVRL